MKPPDNDLSDATGSHYELSLPSARRGLFGDSERRESTDRML